MLGKSSVKISIGSSPIQGDGVFADEELTFIYAINGDNDGNFECHCGSARCRHVYYGNFFKLPIAIQQEYLELLDDWFVKKYSEALRRMANL